MRKKKNISTSFLDGSEFYNICFEFEEVPLSVNVRVFSLRLTWSLSNNNGKTSETFPSKTNLNLERLTPHNFEISKRVNH